MSVNESKSDVVGVEQCSTLEAKVQNTLARSALYQFLSLCFFEPKEKTFSVLKSDDYLGNVRESLDDYLTFNSFNGNASAMRENLQLLGKCFFKEKSFEELASEYRKVFGTFIAAKECPIYETLYGSTDAFQQTRYLQELADIGGFYRAFNLNIEDSRERYDHMSIELEFMHLLTYKEAYALENHGDEQLGICTNAEKKFLKSHLARWVPLFTKLVNKRTKDSAYLGSAANLLRDFISCETKLLKVRVEEDTELNAELMKEEPFQCGACETTSKAEGFDPNSAEGEV